MGTNIHSEEHCKRISYRLSTLAKEKVHITVHMLLKKARGNTWPGLGVPGDRELGRGWSFGLMVKLSFGMLATHTGRPGLQSWLNFLFQV